MSVSQGPAYEAGGGIAGTAGTAAIEAIAAIAIIVLTILGLAKVAPVFLVAVAVIIAGIALLAQGYTLAGEYAAMLSGRGDALPIRANSTWTLSLLAGAAGIVLGILALLSVTPMVLVAVAVIAFGGGLVISSGPMAQVGIVRVATPTTDERTRRMVAEAASTAAVSQAMVGLGAVVLGILALAGFASVTLILVALLAVGVFELVNGASVGELMLGTLHH